MTEILAVDYYRKLKELYSQDVHKSQFIYIYTMDGVVEKVGFRFRKKNKFKLSEDAPKDKLLLSRDLKLPRAVIVQVSFSPLEFKLLDG